MIEIPNMLMIGGNSRNAGKTTLACKVIEKISANYPVIGLKVTSIRPGEADLHGSHSDDDLSGYSIIEEVNSKSNKDTSLMLQAGASRVFYVRANEGFGLKAMVEFMTRFNTNQPIICESRSLRNDVTPGLFIMVMHKAAAGKEKDVSFYLGKADHVQFYSEDQENIDQTASRITFSQQKFSFE